MVNKRLQKGKNARVVSFTISDADLKTLNHIAKSFKNRSEAIRYCIERAWKPI